MSPAKVMVLMSTYNGECFLYEQIASIIDQTYKNWILLIRDDGSQDKTIDVIRKCMAQDSRIIFDDSCTANLGVKDSFTYLMEKAMEYSCDYFMFCDQDDIWFQNKIALQLDQMGQMTMRYGYSTPLMVFSDLLSTDEELSPDDKTFFQANKLNGYYTLDNILISNIVVGCTIMMNKTLLRLTIPMPSFEVMHDAWVASVAKAYGEVFFIEQPMLFYRQHASNVIGLKKQPLFLQFLKKMPNINKRFKYVCQKARRLLGLSANCAVSTRETLVRCSNLLSQGRVKRFYVILKYRIYPQRTTRIIAWLFMLLLAKKTK